ncbi:MAG TPA: DMT family transporter [Polyangiaceae bacterium]|nr:DMT family transporter [Polyangiaceae bacterium]
MRQPASPALNPLYPVLVLLAGSTLWGLSWMPLKYFGAYGILGVSVTLVAHGSVGALATPWLLLRRATWAHRGGSILLLAVLGGLANLSFATAIVKGDVVRVMVLFYLLPAWGVIGGWWILGERVDRQRKLSLGLALLGAFLILGGVRVFSQSPTWIDLLAVISGMALALNNVLFRKLRDVPVAPKIAASFVGCLLWAAPLTFLGVQALPVGVPLGVWLELAAFGLLYLSLATVCTLWGVAHMQAGKSSVLIIMELVTAVASAAVLSRQNLAPLEWLGAGAIMLAALLEARRPPQVELALQS